LDVRLPAADELGAGVEIEGGRWARLAVRADRLAAAAAVRPYRSMLAILSVNLVLVALFAPIGAALFSDPAELFRELMPATWLSTAELVFIAVVAWGIHVRVTGVHRLRLDNFWGLSAAFFAFFAMFELTDASHFTSELLYTAGTLEPAGFRDLDAFLLTVIFLSAAAALMRNVKDVLPHRRALVLFGIGVLLAAGSQTLDSLVAVSSGEFVAEETLKLAAEPFLIGGFLVVLQRVTRPEPASEPGRVEARGV
jgi:hypothetical protein